MRRGEAVPAELTADLRGVLAAIADNPETEVETVAYQILRRERLIQVVSFPDRRVITLTYRGQASL